MTTATMSPKIKKLLDEILSNFNVGEPLDPHRPIRTRPAVRDDREVTSAKETKSPPSKAFVNSVRKKARAT